MVNVLLFVFKSGRIRVSRLRSGGCGSPNNSRKRHLSAGDPTDLSYPRDDNCHPLALAERCFSDRDTPYINAASLRAEDTRDMAESATGERTMQPYNNSDPRISKALTYLQRIRQHCRSERGAIYESWVDNSPAEQLEIEVTTKNLNVVCALHHAIHILGGTLLVFHVARLYFCNDAGMERHAVAVIRFRLD